jgi:uncharacterized protein YbbC (DUF1343 family)
MTQEANAHDSIAFQYTQPRIKVGLEVLLENEEWLAKVRGKKVGLITNPTGVNHNLESNIDLLHQHPDIEVVALFGPEHGIRGDAYAGDKVESGVDEKTGITVHSLYGKTRKPDPAWLEGLDLMIYDIQDVGSRSYTYIYTMAYAMEACAAKGIPFMVLDRPNPAGAHIVDGNILNPKEYATFVGLYAIPYQYGMTPGEAALMFNDNFTSGQVQLEVVPVEGYSRSMMPWDTGFPFVPSSTHIVQQNHATYYNLTGIIGEIPHISIGVGYTLPFETMAAPWIDRDAFVDAINARNIPGLRARPISYVPRYASYAAKGDTPAQPCHGAHLVVTDYHALRPFAAQIHLMHILHSMYPEQELFTDTHAKKPLFDEVLGTDDIRRRLLAGESAEVIIASYDADLQAFLNLREKYLIYKD